MATIREWLNEAGFNWEKGKIIHQEADNTPGWDTGGEARYIDDNADVLNREFYAGFGGPECPRFIAKDDKFIYFPSQYDGATQCEKISVRLDYYLKHDTPYPGG